MVAEVTESAACCVTLHVRVAELWFWERSYATALSVKVVRPAGRETSTVVSVEREIGEEEPFASTEKNSTRSRSFAFVSATGIRYSELMKSESLSPMALPLTCGLLMATPGG